MSFRRYLLFLLVIISVMVLGLVMGVAIARAQQPGDVVKAAPVERESYFDTATCRDYTSVPRNDRIQRNRELFRQLLSDPGYIRVQLECAQNPSMLRRMEMSIERMCKGREDYLVRNAWTSALNAHKYTCNWR